MNNSKAPRSSLTKQDICLLYTRDEKTLREIAAYAGVSHQRIHAILKDNGVPLRPRSVKKDGK